MFPGTMADKTTPRGMLKVIQQHYSQAERIWVMDRGIPTEPVLEELRTALPCRRCPPRFPDRPRA